METALKSTLQEYCHRMGFPLPTYTTTRCGGPDHEPLFISQATIDDVIYTGVAAGSKSRAENSAAYNAYLKMSAPHPDLLPIPSFTRVHRQPAS